MFAAAGPKSKDKLSSAQNDLQDILDELKGSHVALAKSMRQSPLTPENLTKIQGDRLASSLYFILIQAKFINKEVTLEGITLEFSIYLF